MNTELQELEAILRYAKLKNIRISLYREIDLLIHKLIDKVRSEDVSSR